MVHIIILYITLCVKMKEFETLIRAVYYLLNSIARQTSLEIREFFYPGRVHVDKRRAGVGFKSTALWNTKRRIGVKIRIRGRRRGNGRFKEVAE